MSETSLRTQRWHWDNRGDRTGMSVPEPWFSLALENGMVDPGMNEPSINGISRATGVSVMTVSRILKKDYGERGPSPALLKKFAEGFGVAPEMVTDFLGMGKIAEKPWERPAAADYLNELDGKLVTQLILRLTKETRRNQGVSDDVAEQVEVEPAKKVRAAKVARRPAKATAGGSRKRG